MSASRTSARPWPSCARSATQAHADGLEVMLEVVSTSRDDELRSIAAAAEIGVDWVLGGTHPQRRAPGAGRRRRHATARSPGPIVGHPSVLLGEIGEIAASARAITALDGVLRPGPARLPAPDRGRGGTDPGRGAGGQRAGHRRRIGRHRGADHALEAAGAWGFTIGGAIFEGRLPGGPSVGGQIREVLRLPSVCSGAGQAGSGGRPDGRGRVSHRASSCWPSTRAARRAGAVVLDARLAPVAVASRPLATSFPAPGRVEHDAGQILAGVLGAISDALAQAGADWPDVAGLGLAAQTETFVVWDRATGQAGLSRRSAGGTPGPPMPAPSCAPTGCEPDVRTRTGLPLEPAFSALEAALAAGRGARGPGGGGPRPAALRRRQLLADLAAVRRRRARHRSVHGRPHHAVRPERRRLGSGPARAVRRSRRRCCLPIAPTAGPFGGTEAGDLRWPGRHHRERRGPAGGPVRPAMLASGPGQADAGYRGVPVVPRRRQRRRPGRPPGWCPAAPGSWAARPAMRWRDSCPTPAG